MLQKELGACIEYLLVYITDKVDVVEMKDVFVSSNLFSQSRGRQHNKYSTSLLDLKVFQSKE